MPPSTDRIAAVETRVDEHAHELARQRRALEQLLGDRSTLRLAIRELARLRREMPRHIDEAAASAVARAEEARTARRRGTWTFRAQMTGGLAAAAGAGLGLAQLLHL